MRISDWSSDVCSSDLYRLGSRRCFQRQTTISRRSPSRSSRASVKLPLATRVWASSTLKASRPHRVVHLKSKSPSISTPTVFCTRSEEHTSELQSLMRISYAVFCLKKKNKKKYQLYH